MSWLYTILIGILSAALGAFSAGLVAYGAVSWFRIPAREGQSGYFIIFMGLLGLVAGLIIGVITSRVAGGENFISQAKAGGLSLLIIVVMAGLIAGVSYLLADLPPTLDGKRLHLEVEVQCPASYSGKPDSESSEFYLQLSGPFTGSGREYRPGKLAKDQARQIDGRWVMPGGIDIISSAPDRTLGVTINSQPAQFLHIPLAGKPSPKDESWTPWAPMAYLEDLSKPAPGTEILVRYRVQRSSEE